ncbi:MAG: polysulfide reductase NrfD [Deltaproteobacteria bacterium]|nr:polysulfide reductase NrfD [Deltaproteobacteria bacterium]
MEVTVTGLNALAFPHMHIWDWRVALYLFLGGLSAGLAVMAAVLHLRKNGELVEGEAASWIAPLCVPVVLGLGMLFIFLDLEHKLNVYRLYLTVQPLSPMSWGSWGLLAFFPLSALFVLATLPERLYGWLMLDSLRNLARRLTESVRIIAFINLLMGIFIGIYTGVLLSSFVARPLWNSSILPVLFLLSALSAGAALMIIVSRSLAAKLFFTKLDIFLIAAEMTVLPLFFYGQYTSSSAHRASILPFFAFTHEYLWFGSAIILLGVIFPFALVLKLLEIREGHVTALTPAVLFRMNLSAALVLLGSAIVRFAFVYAGQLSHYL